MNNINENTQLLIRYGREIKDQLDEYYTIYGADETLTNWVNKLIKNDRSQIANSLKCVADGTILLPVNFILENYDIEKLVKYLTNFQNVLPEEDFLLIKDTILQICKCPYGYNHEEFYLLECATKIKKIDKNEILTILKDNLVYALDVIYKISLMKDVDVNLAQDALIKSVEDNIEMNDLESDEQSPLQYVYKFLRDVPNADADKLIDYLCNVDTNFKVQELYLTALHYVNNIKNAEKRKAYVNKLEQALIKVSSHNPNCAEWLYLFAKNIKDANIQALEKAIINTQNTYYIYLFAKNIKDVSIKELDKAMSKLAIDENSITFANEIADATLTRKKIESYFYDEVKGVDANIDYVLELNNIN